MRTFATLTTLFVGLAFVFWAPAAKADCPHKDNFDHRHCPGEPSDLEELESRVTDLEDALSSLEAFVFVGFSEAEINPGVDDPGYPGMHAACQETFGPVARLCTGKEYALSLDVVGAPTSAGAWVHPVVPFGRAGIDCLGWAADTNNSGGTIVTEAGGFEERACNSTRPVTCCRSD